MVWALALTLKAIMARARTKRQTTITLLVNPTSRCSPVCTGWKSGEHATAKGPGAGHEPARRACAMHVKLLQGARGEPENPSTLRPRAVRALPPPLVRAVTSNKTVLDRPLPRSPCCALLSARAAAGMWFGFSAMMPKTTEDHRRQENRLALLPQAAHREA